MSYQVDELEDNATQNYHVEEAEAEEKEEVEQNYIDSEGDLTEEYFGALFDFFSQIIEAGLHNKH